MANNNAILSTVESAAIDGRMRTLRIRQEIFHSLFTHLSQHSSDLIEATKSDDNISRAEAQIIFAAALIELRNHYNSLDFAKDLELEYSLARGKSNESRRVPTNITYIIPDTSALFFSVISALSAAIAAGSCVVVELQNTALKTPSLLNRLLSECLSSEAFAVLVSRAPAQFLSKCVIVDAEQKIGGLDVLNAQNVLNAPIRQNVAIIDRTADAQLATKEVVAARLVFGGTSRYAPDILLVNEFHVEKVKKQLVEGMKSQLSAAESDPQGRANIGTKTARNIEIETEVNKGRARLVWGSSEIGIIEITDRTSSLMSGKQSGKFILLNKFSSLDDTIDLLNRRGINASLGALYLFAGPREAKYLSQYISTQVSFVNHIPSQILIGPITPSRYQVSLSTRYNTHMFEGPSPQINRTSRSHIASRILNNDSQAALLVSIAQKPLKPTGQVPAGAWGFFEQGMVLGAVVYLLPLVGLSLAGIGYAGFRGFRAAHNLWF